MNSVYFDFLGFIITVISTYYAATYKGKKKIKDPQEVLFGGYEKLLNQQERVNSHLQAKLDEAWSNLDNANKIIHELQSELSVSRQQNKQLIEELKTYRITKGPLLQSESIN